MSDDESTEIDEQDSETEESEPEPLLDGLSIQSGDASEEESDE